MLPSSSVSDVATAVVLIGEVDARDAALAERLVPGTVGGEAVGHLVDRLVLGAAPVAAHHVGIALEGHVVRLGDRVEHDVVGHAALTERLVEGAVGREADQHRADDAVAVTGVADGEHPALVVDLDVAGVVDRRVDVDDDQAVRRRTPGRARRCP